MKCRRAVPVAVEGRSHVLVLPARHTAARGAR